jgi:hypothetical protein
MEEPRWQTVSNLSIIRIWVAPWHGHHHARGCEPGFDEHDDVVLATSQCNAAQKNQSREYGCVGPMTCYRVAQRCIIVRTSRTARARGSATCFER